MTLTDWTPRPRPARAPLEGRYVRLEPLAQDHAPALFDAATAPGAEDRFRWLFETPPESQDAFGDWLERAAERFGFRPEGVFRQHMVVKGESRDTAWFAMTDGDWQRLRPLYLAWLHPDNFDAAGRQKEPLRI